MSEVETCPSRARARTQVDRLAGITENERDEPAVARRPRLSSG